MRFNRGMQASPTKASPGRFDAHGAGRFPARHASRFAGRLAGGAATLLDWLLPTICVVCERPLPPGLPAPAEPPRGWCTGCAATLPGLAAPRCPRCGERSRPGQACAACRMHPPDLDLAFVLADYARPLDHLVQAIKFGRQSMFAAPLGRLLARTVASRWQGPPPDFVVAVPLAPARLAGRGFNQALLLAGPVAAAFGQRPARGQLVRLRESAPASSLGAAERRQALAQAFAARSLRPGACVLVVDDVMTTGATLFAAARALKAAGAARVAACVAARTLPPGFDPGDTSACGIPSTDTAAPDPAPSATSC
jgi:ComF family protein